MDPDTATTHRPKGKYQLYRPYHRSHPYGGFARDLLGRGDAGGSLDLGPGGQLITTQTSPDKDQPFMMMPEPNKAAGDAKGQTTNPNGQPLLLFPADKLASGVSTIYLN